MGYYYNRMFTPPTWRDVRVAMLLLMVYAMDQAIVHTVAHFYPDPFCQTPLPTVVVAILEAMGILEEYNNDPVCKLSYDTDFIMFIRLTQVYLGMLLVLIYGNI
jgi:hypothetical protein